MEWLDGLERLRQWQSETALVYAAHPLHIVQRDLKPSNIMLVEGADGSERIKVIDFGLIRRWNAEPATTPSLAQAELVQSRSMFISTPRYASPEQCRAEAIDGSLLLTGHDRNFFVPPDQNSSNKSLLMTSVTVTHVEERWQAFMCIIFHVDPQLLRSLRGSQWKNVQNVCPKRFTWRIERVRYSQWHSGVRTKRSLPS